MPIVAGFKICYLDVMATQLTLDIGIKVKKKRVRYKTPSYIKTYKNDVNTDGKVKDDNIWQQMHQVYQTLANYCFEESFNRQTEVFEYQGLHIWHEKNTKGKYNYYGETFQGQEFDDGRYAEIIGTENWFIDRRLEAHKMLLTFLSEGREIKESVIEVLALMKGGINE